MRTVLSHRPFTLADFQVWDKDAAIPQQKEGVDDSGAETEVPDYGPVVFCTSSARYIADKIGRDRAKVVGFFCSDNGDAGVCDMADGHDWVIVDDRFYIDWWAKFIEAETKQVAFDIQDPKDAAFIAKFYGDPKKWTVVDDKQEARNMKTTTRAAVPPKFGIGDLVRLKKAISSFKYGQINGFVLDPEDSGVGPHGSTPFNGAKVLQLSVKLKKSPLFTDDYGSVVKLKSTDLILISEVGRSTEIEQWKKQQSMNASVWPPQLRLGVAASFRKLRAMADSDHAKEGETLGAFIAKLKAFKAEDDGSDAKTAREFAEMLDIQASKGNWDANSYMHGMLNGMVLMAWTWALNYGIVEQEDGMDCPYLSAPAAGFTDKDDEQ